MSVQASSLLANALPFVAGGMSGQLHAFLQYLATQSGAALAATPIPRLIYVDNGFTGVADGSIIAPFATIAAAVASSLFVDGTTLMIVNGTYAEAVVIPAARRNISIIGLGSVLIAAAAGVSLSYVPTGAFSATNPPRLFLQNLNIGGAAAGLSVNGTGLANTGASVILQNVNDVSTTGSELRFCDSIEVHGGTFTAPIAIAASRQAFINDAVFTSAASGGLTLDYDAPNAGIVTTHAGYNLNGSNVTLLTHGNEATVVCNKSVTVTNYAVTSLSATAAFSYNIVFQGRISTLMNLGVLPNTGGLTQPTIDLRCSTIAALTVSSDDTSARTILAQGSSILTVTSNAGSQVIALNVRGGLRPPTITFGANFRLNRDQFSIIGLVVPNAAGPGTTFTFGAGSFATEPPFPTGVTYAITTGQQIALSAVAALPFVTAASETAFVLDSTGGTTIDLVVTPISLA